MHVSEQATPPPSAAAVGQTAVRMLLLLLAPHVRAPGGWAPAPMPELLPAGGAAPQCFLHLPPRPTPAAVLGAAAAYVAWLKTGPTGDTAFPAWQANRAAGKWRSREGRAALEETEALGALPQHTAL